MINKVVLVGRLARDPNELRYSANNVAFVSFTIAVDNRFSRQADKSADFINCVAFNKTAEFISKYARKGALSGVEGRLQSRSYNDKDGKKVFVLEVVVDAFQLLESKSVAEARNNEMGNPSPSRQNNDSSVNINDLYDSNFSQVDVNDDDLPF